MASKKKQEEDVNLFVKIIGLVIVILFVIIFANIYTKKSVEQDQEQLSQSNQMLLNKLSQLENEVSNLKEENKDQSAQLDKIPDHIYMVEKVGEYDRKIVRINIEEGKEEILVESVKDLAGIESRYEGMVDYAVFPSEDIIIFKKLWTGAGADEKTFILDFWRYDANKGTIKFVEDFTELRDKNLSIHAVPSEDKQHIAFTLDNDDEENPGSATYLFIYDLLNDQIKNPIILEQGQTFNAYYGYPKTRYDFEWKDARTIVVSIFDQTKADAENNIEKPLIEKKDIMF